jgi:hypothetical protein
MRQAVDDMLTHYIAWREAAAAVRTAYARCSGAPDGKEDAGFSAYLAALDQEEASAANYALALARVEGLLRAQPDRSTPAPDPAQLLKTTRRRHSVYDDPTQATDIGELSGEDPTEGRAVGGDDPTRGHQVGARPDDDPAEAARVGELSDADPTQAADVGLDPSEDPTA